MEVVEKSVCRNVIVLSADIYSILERDKLAINNNFSLNYLPQRERTVN